MEWTSEGVYALRSIAAELSGIRRALETAIAPAPQEPQECQHPQESRKTLSGFGEPEEFVCGVCGGHFQAELEPAGVTGG